MGDQQAARGEVILDIAAESPAEFDPVAGGQGPGFHEQQLLLEMLADPDVGAALDALDAEDAAGLS
ncbi:MAG: hypothetical protein JWN61_932 [Pseudonocardiales bacterium]|nr:hypothetical protein [Pseudonocardiales bacterium]